MRTVAVWIVAGTVAMLVAGCRGTSLPTTLEQQTRARALASELSIQFVRGADASNRAVMAETDDAAGASARESEQAAARVQRGIESLKPLLEALGYSREAVLLDEFTQRFDRYRTADREILDLAVENTNLKAQRLSFGAGQEAADAVRNALRRAAPGSAPTEARLLSATALADLREIQVIQARHIAEADDASMTQMETAMAASAAAARRSIASLAGADATDAAAAFDRFMAVNAEIVRLSRRNSDVRSLALSLGETRLFVAACEETLDALQAALETHAFAATR